uniref:D-isomer specific 2-hydroxyacid dehydrogenase NAD-binding domain-containing protein n=1 Tax=Rhizochromulina marina TaxID=1034831 RepID=A0A7S2WPN2_9STRA|mmetsp:Transcript_30274/g.88148  ORF Transcript_30274/g.88148 Transcript_30274/m.88148 type:complete len:374 (+) Transcript_30274:3-1124(+)
MTRMMLRAAGALGAVHVLAHPRGLHSSWSLSAPSQQSPHTLIAVAGSTEHFQSLEAVVSGLPVELLLVGQSQAEIRAQAPALARASGLLWIPSAGGPGHQQLNRLWPMLPGVSWVHSFSAGVDGLKPFIDHSIKPLASQGKVSLSNGRGAFSSSLAEYSLTAMLYFNKMIQRCEANRRGRVWDKFIMPVMHGKTIGLVGYGSIGKATGTAAKQAFGCRILALRRRPGQEADGPADECFGFDDRFEFFRQCDYVVASLPSTPLTQKFIGQAELDAMKPSAVLISIGRGATVDEDALEATLKAGKLRGAAMDVFATEPLPKDSGLWDLENVLITAHNADFTEDYFQLGCSVWRKNLVQFLAGEPLVTPVDVNAGY